MRKVGREMSKVARDVNKVRTKKKKKKKKDGLKKRKRPPSPLLENFPQISSSSTPRTQPSAFHPLPFIPAPPPRIYQYRHHPSFLSLSLSLSRRFSHLGGYTGAAGSKDPRWGFLSFGENVLEITEFERNVEEKDWR